MRRGWLLGVGIVAGCFTAEDTAAPPGVLEKFDPVANYAAMAAYAGSDAKLVTLRASFVNIDGTMDLTAEYRPYVDATFVTRATEADVAAQGPVAPGSGFVIGDGLTTRLSVRSPHWQHVSSGGSEWDEKHLGMERRRGGEASRSEKIAAPPTCSFAGLWQQAIGLGAPKDVVANIVYDADGYMFEANGRDFRRKFAADCSPLPE